MRKIGRFFWKYWVILAGVALVMTGGISGCGSSEESVGTGGAQTGTVVLLLTDHPADTLKAVNVTINEISLISDGQAPVVLYMDDAGRRVNLLALEEVQDLFMISEDVPARAYHKIRLRVSDPEFVFMDDHVVDSSQIHLVAGGKVDLILRQPVRVVAGETLTVLLDIDAEKAVHIHQSSSRYEFRPVVFITLLHRDRLPERFVQMEGFIKSVDAENRSFLLVRPLQLRQHIAQTPDGGASISSSKPHIEDLDELPDLDDHDYPRHTIKVVVGEDTRIFDESGRPVGFDALEPGLRVVVRGILSFDDGLYLKATLVKIGKLVRLRGGITSPVDDMDQFGFMTVGERDLTVQIWPDTLIFDLESRSRIEPEDLRAGMRALIEGAEETSSGVFNAATVLVKPALPTPLALKGTVEDLDAAERMFTLVREDSSEVFVKVKKDAVVLSIGKAGDKLDIRLISLEDLENGDEVRLFGHFLPTAGPIPSFEAFVVVVLESGSDFEFDIPAVPPMSFINHADVVPIGSGNSLVIP